MPNTPHPPTTTVPVPAPTTTDPDPVPAPAPTWWDRCTTMFTDEQRASLGTDDTHNVGSRAYVYAQTPAPPEHHTQLLEALQLGTVDDDTSLFRRRLDRTFTSAGRHTLRKWLEHPLTSAPDVRLRTALREAVTTDAPSKAVTLQETRASLAAMEESWRSLTWCWHDDRSKGELLKQLLFGSVFAPLNDVPLAQNAYHHMRVVGSPVIQCLAPLVPIVISFVMLRWMGAGMSFRECWDMSSGVFKNAFWFDQTGGGRGGGGGGGGVLLTVMRVVKWLWWILFVANVALMVYHSYRHYTLLSHVYRRVYRAAKWVHDARHLVTHAIGGTTAHAADTNPEVAAVADWAADASPTYSLFTHAHGFLKTYQRLRSPAVRRTCEGWVRHVGVLDAVQSVDTLLRHDAFVVPEVHDGTAKTNTQTETEAETETETKRATGDDAVTLELDGAFHPLLDAPVPHAIVLDKHVVLTGSNASGKSTVLKTLLLNVLLAQSWGIASARRMRWTPFASIRGYLHTVDDCGRESLFQAQIRRIEAFIVEARAAQATAQAVVQAQATAPSTPAPGPSLLVVDEILNSTNPIEAMLLSYQYARIVGKELTPNARMVMTTHYPVLTTLATKYPTQFANWAMGAGYTVGVGDACHASSAIGTVRAMTQVLDATAHERLEKAYERMYKRLRKMRFRELDGGEDEGKGKEEVKGTGGEGGMKVTRGNEGAGGEGAGGEGAAVPTKAGDAVPDEMAKTEGVPNPRATVE